MTLSKRSGQRAADHNVKTDWKVWNEFLVDLFKKFRFSPGWPTLFECHDAEDQDYFWMLEDEMDKGRLSCVPWKGK